jgi:ketosteroid isomerase-like protein
MATTMETGRRLVELCSQGKFNEAMNSLYADDIVSVEAMTGPNMPARMEGIAAVRKKGEWWEQNHEIHSVKVEGPWPHGDRFIVRFIMEVTAKAGPMAGKRMHLDEAGLYTVKGGKIVQEEFFYDMGG